jgi:hypothetical protein
MKYFFALMLALSLTVTAYASSVQWEKCCPDAACEMIDCAEMGCLPATTAALPPQVAGVGATRQIYDLLVLPMPTLPSSNIDIWTPPD